MKRIYVIICSLSLAAIFFTLCFFVSYKVALNNFNKHANETKQIIQVGTNKIETITPFTNLIVKKYDATTKTLTTQIQNGKEELVGYTREELVDYCKRYMNQISPEDKENGLVSCDVESFSEDKVVIRKNYDSNTMEFEYFIASRNGFITVFYHDKQTVFEYTNIETKYLPQYEIDKLEEGIYVKDKNELYTILEGYSS